jgi:hypothetical protein
MIKDAIIDIALFSAAAFVFAAVAFLSEEAGVSKIVVLIGYTACMLLVTWFLLGRAGHRNREANRLIFGDDAEDEVDARLLSNELFQERPARPQTPPALPEKRRKV